MRYTVTGAAGFIGLNLCEKLLANGHNVLGTDNFVTGKREVIDQLLKDNKFTFVEGSLTEVNTCKRVCADADFVLHQAALGSVPRSVEMPADYMRINVMSTVNMLVAAHDAGVMRFVHASSASVYGNVEGKVLDESMPLAPHNPYAASKLAAEEIVHVFWRTYQLPTVALRYFNVFGKGQRTDGPYAAVVPKFISSLLAGVAPIIHGDGKQRRDFTHVDNVVEANLLACEAGDGIAGSVFNVAAGGFTTVSDLYTMIAKEIGMDIKAKHGPARQGDVRGSPANISLAKKFLRYEPKITVSQGIKKTVAWYRDYEKHS